jgi:hypothetical protein
MTVFSTMMKALILTLASCALFLSGTSYGHAQTTSKHATQTNAMNKTLDMDPGDGSKAIQNPSEADIRKAVSSLQHDAEPGFLILKMNAGNMLQVTCVAKGSFAIQVQEGDEKHQRQAVKNLSTDDTITLLLAYLKEDPAWKKLVNWEAI